MASSIKWGLLIAMALLAEACTVALQFGLPAIQGKVFADPHFPRVIVFHHVPPSCIVDFQGNFYAAVAESTLFWACSVFVVTGAVRLVRQRRTVAEM
jgi:hypothetical protein